MWNDFKAAFFLFTKYLTRGNKGTLILTTLVATVAFLQINIITGILSGVINLTYQQTKNIYVSNIVILPGKDQWGNREEYIKQVSLLKPRIDAIPGIIGSSFRYTAGSVIEFDPDKRGKDVRTVSWPVESISPEEESTVSKISTYMVAGSYLEESDRDQMVMGREISGGFGASLEIQSLKGAGVGDEVTAYYHNGVVRKYTVKGIYATAFPLSDMSVFVTRKEMESVLALRDRASKILVKTDEAYPEQHYIRLLREAGLETQDINPWVTFIGLISGLAQSFDIIKRILLVIGLIVAGVTIFIVIFITTTGRKKQIGIMKAIGMKERIIVMSYVLLAFFFALVGIGMGALIIQFLLKPYFIANPLSFPTGKVSLIIVPVEFATGIISMLVVSLIAGLIPSRRIARENIIKAIWG